MYLASLHPPGVLVHPEDLVLQGDPCRLSLLDFLEAPFHLLCQEHLYNGSTQLIGLKLYNHCNFLCFLANFVSKVLLSRRKRIKRN